MPVSFGQFINCLKILVNFWIDWICRFFFFWQIAWWRNRQFVRLTGDLKKKLMGGFTPSGLRFWTPHAFGFRTLVRTGYRQQHILQSQTSRFLRVFKEKLNFFCIFKKNVLKPGFAKYVVDANLFRLGSSIQKYEGFRGVVQVGIMTGEATHQFFFSIFFLNKK